MSVQVSQNAQLTKEEKEKENSRESSSCVLFFSKPWAQTHLPVSKCKRTIHWMQTVSHGTGASALRCSLCYGQLSSNGGDLKVSPLTAETQNSRSFSSQFSCDRLYKLRTLDYSNHNNGGTMVNIHWSWGKKFALHCYPSPCVQTQRLHA